MGESGFDIRSLLSMTAQGVPGFWRAPPATVRWSFDGGYADASSFPIDDLLRLSEVVLRTQTAEAVQYGGYYDGIIYGFPGLRDQLAERASRDDDRTVDRTGVILTSGGTQAISLTLDAFVDPGDVVAVEAPTWGAVLSMTKARGAEVIAIPVDDEGMEVDVLESELDRLDRQGRRLKLLYSIASFNTPTGATLSLARRRRLVELAQRRRFVVIEDDVYRDLRYEGATVETMFSLDDSGLVVKIESFSKTLAPTLRLGWATGHPDVIAALASVREDLGVSQWISRVLSEYLREGLYDSHLDEVRTLYRTKRDAAESALRAYCAPWVRWRSPEGGFFLWIEVDPSIDADAALDRARRAGAIVRMGSGFFGDREQGRQRFRLAFSELPIAEIDRGIAVIGRAMAESARVQSGQR